MARGGGEAARATGRRARPAVRLAAVVALFGALLAASAAPSAARSPDIEAALVDRIAAERRLAGRSPLAVAGDLVEVARRHSATMAAQSRLHHNPGLGDQVADWVELGENVGTGATVDDVHVALMASAAHRDEILGATFTQVGVGVVGAGGALWVTQVFRRPGTGAAVAPASAPAPASSPPPSAPAAVVAPTTAAPGGRRAPARTAATTAAPATVATAAPPTTAPVPASRVVAATTPAAPGTAVPSPTAVRPVPVAASNVLPPDGGVAALGSVAAALLWLAAAAARSSAPRPPR